MDIPNYRDFENGAQSTLDESLLVKFFLKDREDKAKSLTEGRPIFKEVEYIDIRIAGSKDGGACRPATHHDRQRFPRHYAAFQQRIELPTEGTPLAEWPLMQRRQVEELSFHNVKTVEQLVAMSDSNAAQFMGINALKKKAIAWLEHADETARINEIEQLKTDNETKENRITELENLLISMSERLDKVEGSPSIAAQAAKPTVKTAAKRTRKPAAAKG